MASYRPRTTHFTALVAALLLGTAVTPAWADTDRVPPGNPCGDGPGEGTGNPCGGNNGNPGAQGNAGNRPAQPEFEPIDLPPTEDSGVFITQIGDTNRAKVLQGSTASYARIAQDGEGNAVDLKQDGDGVHYAGVAQDGNDNVLDAEQGGTGQTVLLLAQRGNGNEALIRQNDTGPAYSAAAIQQSGDGNSLTLVQEGGDNQARLMQEGNDNRMDAVQLGAGNRLAWSQQGDGLSGTQVVQTGSSNLQITQGSGAAFAPPPSGSGGQ